MIHYLEFLKKGINYRHPTSVDAQQSTGALSVKKELICGMGLSFKICHLLCTGTLYLGFTHLFGCPHPFIPLLWFLVIILVDLINQSKCGISYHSHFFDIIIPKVRRFIVLRGAVQNS